MALSGESALKKSANLESPVALLTHRHSSSLLTSFDEAAPGVDIPVPSPTNNRAMRSMVVKPKPYSCTTSGCTKNYVRRGDLTRHIREAHETSSRLRCPIEGCYANLPNFGFKRMHRLVEHLLKDLSDGPLPNQSHPQLFSTADATWLAHDFNANSGDFQEIVFAANGAGARVKAESATTAYRERVPEKYVGLYFRMLCPVQDCSFDVFPKACRHLSTHWDLKHHLRNIHALENEHAITLACSINAQAIEEAEAHPHVASI